MKQRILVSIAGALIASAATLAAGQTPAPTFVSEPVASAALTGSPDQAIIDATVQALNAEPSLKNSKITVTSEDGVITLTGSVTTVDQATRASRIAATQAGDGKVINAIQPDKAIYPTWLRIG